MFNCFSITLKLVSFHSVYLDTEMNVTAATAVHLNHCGAHLSGPLCSVWQTWQQIEPMRQLKYFSTIVIVKQSYLSVICVFWGVKHSVVLYMTGTGDKIIFLGTLIPQLNFFLAAPVHCRGYIGEQVMSKNEYIFRKYKFLGELLF